MGGEPLYHKRFRELLTLLQDKKHTNFHLTFVTNGSIYDSSIISLLANFKSVVIEISIDGIGNVNNYIRHTSNSEQIVNNIKSWCKHITKNFDIVLRSVPQVLSAINYDQLLEFADNNNLIIDSNDLINPNFMHLNILPNNLKQQVKDKISNKVLHTDCADTVRNINVRDNSNVLHNLQKNAELVIMQLDSKCQDIENKRLEFVDYCVKFDRYRGFNIRDYIPELLDFMNEYGYEQKLYSN
jgi:sulfatase maturation enzyme AslB (radical SAM superfamily)